MCDASMIREYGLLGSFDTVVNMCGEQIALVTGFSLRLDDEEEGEGEEYEHEGAQENGDNMDGEVDIEGSGVERQDDIAAKSSSASEEEREVEEQELEQEGGELEEDQEPGEDGAEEDSEVGKESEDPRSQYVYDGLMYHELQYHSQALSTMLYYRFGVRKEDRVLLLCEQQAGAEVIAMLTCMRLGAVFVPFDTLPLRPESNASVGAVTSCKERLQKIVVDCQPTAAIVVANNDQDSVLLTLASMGLYKVALVSARGGLVDQDATVNSELLGTVEDFHPQINFEDTEQQVKMEDDANAYHPLYILYTSGSTGESKGVIGTYEGLINRIAWYLDTYPYESYAYGSFQREGIVRRTPLTFVDSMAEIFSALLAGIPLIIQGSNEDSSIVDEVDQQQPVMTLSKKVNTMGFFYIIEDMYDLQATRITLIPNMLYTFCQMVKSLSTTTSNNNTLEDFKLHFSSLRYIFISGEECTKVLLDAYLEMVNSLQLTNYPSLVNLYGSTEIAGDVTYFTLCSPTQLSSAKQSLDDGRVPLGFSMEGNIVIVCKKAESDEAAWTVCSEGEVGELLVIGRHVANGYYRNHNPRYQYRFVANPFRTTSEVNRLSADEQEEVIKYPYAYWTGDLGYFKWFSEEEETQPKKLFYYMGREDREVKIRGMKVELDDVERRIKQLLSVDLGVVVMTVKDVEIVAATTTDRTHLVLLVNESILGSHQSGASGNVLVFRRILIQSLPPAYLPDIILPIATTKNQSDSSMRTSSLKVNRQEMKQQVIITLKDMITTTPQQSDTLLSNISIASTDLEAKLILHIWKIFQRTLPHVAQLTKQVKEIESTSFFALGGDSLSAIEVLYQLRHSQEIMDILANNAKTLPSLTIGELQLEIKELARKLLHPSTSTVSTSDVVEPASKRARQEETASIETSSKRMKRTAPLPITWTEVISRGFCTTPSSSKNNFECGTSQEPHWKVKLLQCVDASPVLATGFHTINKTKSVYAYIGSHGGDILCVDTASGETMWSDEIYEHIEGHVSVDLSHQSVLVTSYVATDIHLTGAIRPNQSEHATTCRHIYYDDEYNQSGKLLEAITRTDSLGSLRAYDMSSGELKWCFHSMGEIKSSPLLNPADNKVVFTACYNGFVYKLNRSTGALLQSTRVEGSVFANPLIDPTGNKVYIATTRGFVYCLSAEDLSEHWMYDSESNSIFSTPLLHPLRPDMLIVCYTDGCIRCIGKDEDRECNGKMLWEQALSKGPFFSSQTLLPETISSCCRYAIVGNHDGNLRVIQLRTDDVESDGSCVMTIPIGTVIFSTPFVALDSNTGMIHCFLATTSGNLYRATFPSSTLVQDVEDMDVAGAAEVVPVLSVAGEIFSSPVVYDSKLYVGSRDDYLYCIQL